MHDAIAVRKSAEAIGLPPLRDMAVHCCHSFEKDLASFGGFAKVAFSPGCRVGCVPPCEIAACCKEKAFLTCADCSEMRACKKLDRYREVVQANLLAIQKIGLSTWASAQWTNVIRSKRQKLRAAIDEAVPPTTDE